MQEPDREEWRHRGFPCLITRTSRGNLCGYVAVPPGHPWHGRDNGELDADCHGGLTYASKCAGEICHVPKAGEPDDVWWLGFDCAHGFDLLPIYVAALTRHGLGNLILNEGPFAEVYRTFPYVRGEVVRLAEQADDAQAVR